MKTKELLENYTHWLVKHNYTDSDVYIEEPTAVERYLKEMTTKCTCKIDEECNLTIDNACYWHGK